MFLGAFVCLLQFAITPKVMKESLWNFYMGRAWPKEGVFEYPR